MELKICIWNWEDYNEGISSWKWFKLPDEADNLIDYIKDWEEPFICDSEHSFIDEDDDIYSVIDFSQDYANHGFYDFVQDYYDIYSDDYIYDMGSFDEMFCGVNPLDIAQRIFYGDFNPNHDYFIFDGYENLKSLTEYDREKLEEGYYNEAIEYAFRNY
ncbi:hypothetical protein [Eremococcus coleocola]|uniref:hypothetical protein n=1 Tax=Eremococcus coleocola TaxID=88132 RepID=UPI0003F8CB1E|nr:hypothetical protein [Eremococcus coleocola]